MRSIASRKVKISILASECTMRVRRRAECCSSLLRRNEADQRTLIGPQSVGAKDASQRGLRKGHHTRASIGAPAQSSLGSHGAEG
jgi:hypothetical protein